MPMHDRDTRFDRFIAEALAPPDRDPDPRFVDRVRQQVRLDELLRARRASMFERLGIELLSLVALGCGLAAIGAVSEVAAFARQVPHVALAGVMLVFALWVPLIALPARRRDWSW
jgi:hypothetical protein